MTERLPPLTVLCDHPDWLALHKPVGISMHSDDGQPGLVVIAVNQLGIPLWPVHRLDKVTSGVLLLAKNATTAARLSTLFAEHRMQKFYLAQSQGKPAKKQGWIKGDMVKARKGCWMLTRSMENPAITRFISHFDKASGKRLFLLKPMTGKTHQLRVAMKSLGCPIEGDERYGSIPSDRTYLHAMFLCWQDDDGQHRIHCQPDCGQWAEQPAAWQQPWTLF